MEKLTIIAVGNGDFIYSIADKISDMYGYEDMWITTDSPVLFNDRIYALSFDGDFLYPSKIADKGDLDAIEEYIERLNDDEFIQLHNLFVADEDIQYMSDLDEELEIYNPTEIINMSEHDGHFFDTTKEFFVLGNDKKLYSADKAIDLSKWELEELIDVVNKVEVSEF